MGKPEVSYAVAARPHADESRSGDGWSIARLGNAWRFAVVDGLGHGPEATRAALAVTTALEETLSADIESLLAHCHERARGTRGAALSIAILDVDRAELVFGGLGNVEGRLLGDGAARRLVPARGIVGAALRRSHPVTLPIAAGSLLLLHSDGVSGRFSEQGLMEQDRQPQELAHAILAAWGRVTDDATVLVIRFG